MNARRIAAAIFLLSAMAIAQTTIRVAPGPRSQPPGLASAMPGMMLPGGMKAPEGMFDEFWKDPATAAELRLTDSQKKQLDEQAMQLKLALVDNGADGMKSFILLSAIVDADSFDDAAYKKQVDVLASTAGKVIQNVAEMIAARRRILTGEQYAKLRSLQKARRAAKREAEAAAARCGPVERGRVAPRVPSSLTQPMQEGFSIQGSGGSR